MITSGLELLKRHFGFTSFRRGQEEVVRAIMDGKSAAAIFPTGSGKSLCYQLPAIQLPHLTLVVSPLLALMQDQLSFLAERGVAAASIDSSQSREQAQGVMAAVREGHIKILMISVERLNNERFRHFIAKVPISLLVVDEAHCISEWGHNFRPDYLKIPLYCRQFNIPQTLLLTATATTKVIADMSAKFAIDKQDITLTGFYRSNLKLAVVGVNTSHKLEYLLSWLKGREQRSGIIYVTLQQSAVDLAKQLRERGIPAQAYHAGMDNELRQTIQQRFMASSKGVIVATIAFGMGIDKSDIRFVVHYDLPKSIENYAQEIGRAGRDGLDSDCLVLANRDNINVLENFIYGDTPELQAIRYVLDDIVKNLDPHNTGTWEIVLNTLSNNSNIRLLSLKTLLVYLELLEVIKPLYSYFADYKFRFIEARETILCRFEGERRSFVESIFESSTMAKKWVSVDFDKLFQEHSEGRSRAVTALDFLDQQGLIELQVKQMTQVYEVLQKEFNLDQLCNELFARFDEKEQAEVHRIHSLLSFFTSHRCLSKSLAGYFSDHQLDNNCGHCSVCEGKQAQLPEPVELQSLNSFDFSVLSKGIIEKLGVQASPVLITRFLCGLTTPIFTKIKARSMPAYGQFEHYRFSEVKAYIDRLFP